MNLKKEYEELKNTEKILKYFGSFGLKDDVEHILSPSDENPTITFKAKTKKDFNRIFNLLKKDMLDIYKEEKGCTGINPILPVEVIEDGNNITLLKGGFTIDTATLKYDQEVKIRFFILNRIKKDNSHYFSIWIETDLSFFDKDKYIIETIKDVYETERAREYNPRHEVIETRIPRITGNKGIIQVIKFWGGHYTHYATTDAEADSLYDFIGIKGGV